MGKLKVFEAASQLGLSSEALIAVLKDLNFPPRGYTSYISDAEFEAARSRLRSEKHQFKESIRRRRGAPQAERPQAEAIRQQVQRNVRQTLAKAQGRQVKQRKRQRECHIPVGSQGPSAIKVQPYMTVAEVAHAFGTGASDIIKKCLAIGMLATVNQRLDLDTIMLIADECGVDVEQAVEAEQEVTRGDTRTRPPVVVVMGHVDHGKTSLLDYIRKAKVVETEVGRITQHTGAYVAYYNDKPIVFLDTPGHESFTAMRARGAQVTDIAVLVVAADEGIMPQTVEALDHARAAGVPIIVALTKSDLPNANPDRVKSQLAQQGLAVEGYGGTTLCVETSAHTGAGVEALLDGISVLALELDLSAPYDGLATGVVIEARVDRGRGNIATVLIEQGTLRRGDPFVAAEFHGRVRDLLNDGFEPVEEATPSFPVQVLGFSGLPQAGDRFDATEDERSARDIAQRRFLAKRDRILSAGKPKAVTLEAMQQRIVEGQIRELKVVLKADVSGSAEALKDSLEGLSLEDVRVRVIHSGVGPINQSDVLLAQASEAIIVGFHVRPLTDARTFAEKEGIEIRTYRIIYAAIDDIRAAMLGLLEPEKKEVTLGRAEVRQVFRIPRQGTIAGSYVLDGTVARDALVRVMRGEKEVHSGKVASLKRFKDDVKEVAAGYECGIGLDDFDEIEVNDILEFYRVEEVQRTA
jgi:translation initiation factor IF-2